MWQSGRLRFVLWVLWIFPSIVFAFGKWEIHRVVFVGNEFFTDDQLLAVVHLKPTEYGIADQFLLSFAHLVLRTPQAPKWLRSISWKVEEEIRQARRSFYNPTVAESDRQLLLQLYNAYGFHDADVTVRFVSDTTYHLNTVLFEIWEGQRAKFDTIVLRGLDKVQIAMRQQIQRLFEPLRHQPVVIHRLNGIAQQAVTLLQDSGYFAAKVDPPVVSYNTATKSDSVTLLFSPGKRYRIATVQIQLDTRGQQPVSQRLIREQIAIQKGEWYQRYRVIETEKQLRRLGNVFEYVEIDTIAKAQWERDSLVGLRIRLRMRKTESVEASLFYAKYPLVTSWDFGGIGEYQHLNAFGAAQRLRLYFRGALRDPVGVFTGSIAPFYELQVGMSLQQPYLMKVFGYPVAARGDILAAQQFVTQQLQLQLFQFGVALPVYLPKQNFFNSMQFGINMQRVKPLNFASAYAEALQRALSEKDSLRIRRRLFLYAVLDTVMNLEKSFFTTSLLEWQISGDTRNHPFFPSRGHFVALGVEAAGILPAVLRGNSRYVRIQAYGSFFFPLGRRWVFALKQRVGHIVWIDRSSYVPLEKHFFAGGSNSLRAWATRTLSAYPIADDAELARWTDIIGGGSVLEGSIEFRFRFRHRTEPVTFLESLIEKVLGWTFFVDWGNMFNSFLAGPQQYNRDKIIPNIALDAGVGIRLGVETAPPVRIDVAFPVYDPHRQLWFVQRLAQLPFRWQIAIGEAF